MNFVSLGGRLSAVHLVLNLVVMMLLIFSVPLLGFDIIAKSVLAIISFALFALNGVGAVGYYENKRTFILIYAFSMPLMVLRDILFIISSLTYQLYIIGAVSLALLICDFMVSITHVKILAITNDRLAKCLTVLHLLSQICNVIFTGILSFSNFLLFDFRWMDYQFRYNVWVHVSVPIFAMLIVSLLLVSIGVTGFYMPNRKLIFIYACSLPISAILHCFTTIAYHELHFFPGCAVIPVVCWILDVTIAFTTFKVLSHPRIIDSTCDEEKAL